MAAEHNIQADCKITGYVMEITLMPRMILNDNYLAALLQQSRSDKLIQLPYHNQWTQNFLAKGLNSELRRQLCSSLLMADGVSYFNPDVEIRWKSLESELSIVEIPTKPMVVDHAFLKNNA